MIAETKIEINPRITLGGSIFEAQWRLAVI
jgi:hypothetical protein